MKKIILLFMCIFIVSCSNEASVGLSDSLDLYNDILDVKFVEEEGIYYIVTDKKIEHKSGVSVVLYENSKNTYKYRAIRRSVRYYLLGLYQQLYVIRNITISLILLLICNNPITLQSDKMLSRHERNDTKH